MTGSKEPSSTVGAISGLSNKKHNESYIKIYKVANKNGF